MTESALQPRTCAGCKEPLTFVGIREIRTGGGTGTETALLQWLVEKDESLLRVALYGCTVCGRLEMFLPPVVK